MKLKTSAIAAAVAGSLVAPMASADFYASARMGVESVSNDDATQESLTFGNLSSRLGWRDSTDLGNGMTAFGHLEVAADGFGLRNLHVGLSGDFGSVKIGESTYAAFYNHVSGPADQPYWIGGSGLIQTGRTADVINYSGSAGSISFDIAVEADGKDAEDQTKTTTSTTGTQVGVSIDMGDWTLGLGVRDVDADADEVTGITISGDMGAASVAASFQSKGDKDGVQLHVGLGSFFINYGSTDDDTVANGNPSEVGVGYSQGIGTNTSWWAEAASIDSDGAGTDGTEVIVALRYDM